MGFDFEQVIVWGKNNLFRDVVTSFFREKGIETKPVLRGDEAVFYAEKGLSLVFAAITNTDNDADYIVKKIKDIANENKVVVLGSDVGVETAVKCVKNGSEDFLILPETREDLEEICQRVFDMGKGSSDSKKETVTKKLVVNDKRMQRVIALADQVASSRAPVFLAGESGTGKEVLARYIHDKSERTGPFIGINCAALPETLLESSLFGHEKGAFTGAVSRKPGKFELADKGTLLLDEITEMPVYLQAKLLRVLQEGEIDRLGGTDVIKVDVRIIAATNRDPAQSVKDGDFRNDLYHRINTIPIKIPALRERPDDVKGLADFFIEKYNEIDARNVKGLTDDALNKLLNLKFNGNVRELENVIRRAILICDGEAIKSKDIILADDFGSDDILENDGVIADKGFSPKPLKEVEKELIFKTLEETEGNRTHAAELLGISVRTLRNKLNSYKSGLAAS